MFDRLPHLMPTPRKTVNSFRRVGCFRSTSNSSILSAFVVKPGKKEWLLDISKDALAARPQFPRSAWVESVDVGWSEYVHVLYGRPVFEGVRSEPKVAEPKD